MKPSPFTLTDILSRENLTRIADTTTFDRGEAYFHQRAVHNLVIGTDEIRAEVTTRRPLKTSSAAPLHQPPSFHPD